MDREGETPRLFSITQQGGEVPLKSYAEENSANPETLARVISEAKELVPSDRFGLVLWSHSMGWLPGGYDSDLVPQGRGGMRLTDSRAHATSASTTIQGMTPRPA